jgi:phosphoribosylformimino-5-aminoimidazole carboxamide ribonucleotide (ProFAR) isomerase
LEKKGLIGAITGKAIYEGNLDLSKAIALCSPKG